MKRTEVNVTMRGERAIQRSIDTGCQLYVLNPQRGWIPVISMRAPLHFLNDRECSWVCMSYGVAQ